MLPTLLNVVNNIDQVVEPESSPQSGLTMLNNIVDNIEQCGQHNIVQSCFQQPVAIHNFLPCSMLKVLDILIRCVTKQNLCSLCLTSLRGRSKCFPSSIHATAASVINTTATSALIHATTASAITCAICDQCSCTRVKTHKLLQVCKQVVASLFTGCQQVVFALLGPSLL